MGVVKLGHMAGDRKKDGFLGEKQINVPTHLLQRHTMNTSFLDGIYITHIGYFPNAHYHWREREHGCDDYILFYCIGGKGHIETANSKHTVQANQFMMLPPHTFHRYQADIDEPWTIYWVHFSGKRLEELTKQFNLEQFEKPCDIQYNADILQTWKEMYASLEQGYTAENFSFSNMVLYHFLSFFLFKERRKQILQAQESGKTGPLDQSIDFMKANVGGRYSVEELAAKFDMSTSHYTALFKKKTGLSPMDYFIRMKVQYACQLLTQSTLKIKEVSDKIGYDDPYYFSRIFKKVTGKSPVQYKDTV